MIFLGLISCSSFSLNGFSDESILTDPSCLGPVLVMFDVTGSGSGFRGLLWPREPLDAPGEFFFFFGGVIAEGGTLPDAISFCSCSHAAAASSPSC